MTNSARISPYSIYYQTTLPRFVEPLIASNAKDDIANDTSRFHVLSCAGREHVLVEINRYLLDVFHNSLSLADREFLQPQRIGNTYLKQGKLFLVSLPGILALGYDIYGSHLLHDDLHRAGVREVKEKTHFLAETTNLHAYAAAVNSAVPRLANPLLNGLSRTSFGNARFLIGNNGHLTATLGLKERTA